MKKRLIAFLLILVILIPCAASAAGWYRLTDRKPVYNLPDYNSKIMDSYRTDWALTIKSSVDSNWAAVTFSNGVTGYVEKKFIVLGSTSTAWISINTAHLKHGPGSSFANEGTLHKGDSVTILTNGSSWSYVSSAVGNGYISNGALSSTKVDASSSSGSSFQDVNYTAWIVSRGDPVGLRSAPSGLSHVVMQTYYPGSQLTVLKYGAEFCFVKMAEDGHQGYMRTKYLSKSKPAQAYALEEAQAASAGSSSSSSSSSAPVSSGFPFTAYARENGGQKPKLYKGEGLGWASDVLEVGTPVNVVSGGSDIYWYKVVVNGKTGYMPSKFLIR